MPVADKQQTASQYETWHALEFSKRARGRGPFSRILLCVLAALSTLLVLEGLARFAVTLGNPNWGPTRQFDLKCELATRPFSGEKTLVLLIGGSFTMVGAYPELIEQEFKDKGLNVEVRNLATWGCSVEEQMAILKLAVQTSGKPVLVISDVRPFAFSKRFNAHGGDVEFKAFSESYLGRRTIDGEASDSLSKTCAQLERVSYLYGFRKYLRFTMLNWMQMVSQPELCRRNFLATQENHDGYSMNGWTPRFRVMDKTALQRGSPEFDHIVQRTRDLVGKPPFEWTDQSTQAAREYCAAQNIPLLFVWYPINPMLKDAWSEAGVDIDLFAQTFTRLRGKSVHFMDLHDCVPDIHDYYTSDHVNVNGAGKFSKILADRLLQPPYVDLIRKHETKTAQRELVAAE